VHAQLLSLKFENVTVRICQRSGVATRYATGDDQCAYALKPPITTCVRYVQTPMLLDCKLSGTCIRCDTSSAHHPPWRLAEHSAECTGRYRIQCYCTVNVWCMLNSSTESTQTYPFNHANSQIFFTNMLEPS
jgi:hypothetical protein